MSSETKVLIGIAIATLLIVIGAVFFVGGKPTPTVENTKPVQNIQALVRPDSHMTGPKNAKVTLVEFGDFQCPGCGVAFPTVQQLVREFEGKINFVFRQYPLQMHKNARVAAQAAEAAGAQGKFFEMEEKLYDNQAEWSESDKALDIFAGYAKNLKLDVDKFKKEVQESKYDKKIQADIKDGDAVGVNATPTFYINGVKQEGGINYQTYKEQFEKLLKK